MENLNQKLGLSAKGRFGEIIPTSAAVADDWQEGHTAFPAENVCVCPQNQNVVGQTSGK